MGLFRRRRETLNEILLREAGLSSAGEAAPEPEPAPAHDARPEPDPLADDLPASLDPLAGRYPAQWAFGSYATAMARPERYDAMTTATVPGLEGDSVEFAALDNGDLIVDVEAGVADLSPLADAAEQHVGRPYRAWCRREEGDLWAVAATEIDVCRFTCELGDRLELVSRDGTVQLKADDRRVNGNVPELEAAGEDKGPDYAVEATRLDGDLWDVQASAL